jgi:hypothetical protein
VLDCERPDVDSKLGGKRQRLVRRERRLRRQTSSASACRALHQRPLGQYGWCLRSVRHPASTTTRSAASTARGASRSGPRRPPLARVTQAERRELRLAISSRLRAAVCARPSNSVCCRWRVASTRFLSRSWLHVHDAALALRLSRRPLRQAAAPLQRAGTTRRASQRLAAQRDRVAHARPGLLRA